MAALVGCYNQGAFVEEAIHSVAAQTYPEFTCVVVDDCSSDDSAKRIEACLAELDDDRFSFIRRRENGGQMATMLSGLEASESVFVAFLDADDAWQPEYLEEHIRAHLHPAGAAAISCSAMVMVDEESRAIAGGQSNFRVGDPRVLGPPERVLAVVDGDPTLVFVARGASHWIWSTTSAMMFRRDAIDAVRPADGATIRWGADGYLARAAQIVGGTVRLEKSLGRYRIHRDNRWAYGRLLGAGHLMGRPDAEREKAIRRLLAVQLSTAADRLDPYLPKEQLRDILISHLGWREIVEYADSEPAVRQLIGGWLNRFRRLALRLGTSMPASLRRSRIRRWLS